MPTNNIQIKIPLWDHYYNDCNQESDLVPYMLKIKLLESGIPVIIDPLSIRSNVINVKHGKLSGMIADTNKDTAYYIFTWTQNND